MDNVRAGSIPVARTKEKKCKLNYVLNANWINQYLLSSPVRLRKQEQRLLGVKIAWRRANMKIGPLPEHLFIDIYWNIHAWIVENVIL